jgi:hypothetical protein
MLLRELIEYMFTEAVLCSISFIPSYGITFRKMILYWRRISIACDILSPTGSIFLTDDIILLRKKNLVLYS